MTRAQRIQKRIFDLAMAILMMPLIVVLFLFAFSLMLIFEKRPYFYGGERMKTPTKSFRLWKFRTMEVVENDRGVSGAHKEARITPIGRFLRRTRGDELPQIWNILKGDISFVGPRPPLREYVERFPDIYAEVLKTPPGVTGLASLNFHAHEEWILSHCRGDEDTDAAYARRCVPRKARIDLIYQRHASVCFDLVLIWRTLAGRFG